MKMKTMLYTRSTQVRNPTELQMLRPQSRNTCNRLLPASPCSAFDYHLVYLDHNPAAVVMAKKLQQYSLLI